MSIKSLTSAILERMSDLNKRRRDFLVHLVGLYLSMRCRKNFLMLERHGQYSEQTYRQHFSRQHDFKAFNSELIREYCGNELVWVFDPSYISKSGRKTPGVGYFWSGCAGKMKWGLELSALGILDIENRTAMHYQVVCSEPVKGEENLRAYYAKLITAQAEELRTTSKYITFDAYFSKKPFVDAICAEGFVLISRMQRRSYMRYAYLGQQTGGRGAHKKFDGKVDETNPCPRHFKMIQQSAEQIVYEGVVHIRALKRWCKVVILHTLGPEGQGQQPKSVLVYFATDVELSGLKVLEYYQNRYQIEFNFRDAKGHLGLEECQSRQPEALDFHFNHVMTTLNIAKAAHWLAVPKEQRGPFSMADIKTKYINELLLDRLISIYGKSPTVEKNNPKILELYNLGRIAT
jgi:Transposase DDE domain